MRQDLLTTREDLVSFRRTINGIKQHIEYDRDYHSKPELFHALDSYLNDVVEHLDEMDSKLKEHVYAYDVTITVTSRVYVKGDDESIAEDAAIEYALHDLSPGIDWTEDDISSERREDEETTTVYDVEV